MMKSFVIDIYKKKSREKKETKDSLSLSLDAEVVKNNGIWNVIACFQYVSTKIKNRKKLFVLFSLSNTTDTSPKERKEKMIISMRKFPRQVISQLIHTHTNR